MRKVIIAAIYVSVLLGCSKEKSEEPIAKRPVLLIQAVAVDNDGTLTLSKEIRSK